MKSPIHITIHSGKMEHIRSISTNPLTNVFCQRMYGCGKSNVTCTKCDAFNLVSFRGSLRTQMEANSIQLSEIQPLSSLPRYSDEFMRFNLFGEIINYNHIINLFNMCHLNPDTYHVVYTKRLISFEEFAHIKPDNLRIIESNPIIDDVKKLPSSSIADMIFNVVTPEYIERHPEHKVNCMQTCEECRKCYPKRTTLTSVVEMIK